MLVYYFILILPLITLGWVGRARSFVGEYLWVLFFLILIFIMGLRDNVGADWNAYIRHYELTQNVTLMEALQTTDPGYAFINWIFAKVSGSIYLVNIICSILILLPLILFARKEYSPWFFVFISILFYIIIIGMSLTRQAVAIGFELLALRSILERKKNHYIIYIICATLFHKTALVLFPLYLLIHNRRVITLLVGIFIFLMLGIIFIIVDGISSFGYYIEEEIISEGAIFRSLYLAIPGLLLFIFRNQLKFSQTEKRVMTLLATLSIGSLGMYISSLTAVDRLFLYLMPFPPMMYTRLIPVFERLNLKFVYYSVVVVFHFILLYAWLSFSNNSLAWIPYENLFFR